MKILIQHEDFDVGAEALALASQSSNTGAIVTFTGLVREWHGDRNISSLFLEHYPGMTETSLQDIADQAWRRWPLIDATIIHRIGELGPNEQIVMVAVSSAHRQAAFEACAFIMDYLKTRAPFWKKCRDAGGEHWVEAKASDEEALDRWR